MTESEMLAPVLTAIEGAGWTVYEEVEHPTSGRRCDAYCTLGAEERGRKALTLTWAIEAKRSLSLSLIEQAESWLPHAHYTSVVLPTARKPHHYGVRLLDRMGAGVIYADEFDVSEDRNARGRIHRPRKLPALNEEMRRMNAGLGGGAAGGYWTPFKRFVVDLDEALPEGGAVGLSALVESIDHHYASDAGAGRQVSYLVRSGALKGCELGRGEGRGLYVRRTGPVVHTGDDPAPFERALDERRIARSSRRMPSRAPRKAAPVAPKPDDAQRQRRGADEETRTLHLFDDQPFVERRAGP